MNLTADGVVGCVPTRADDGIGTTVSGLCGAAGSLASGTGAGLGNAISVIGVETDTVAFIAVGLSAVKLVGDFGALFGSFSTSEWDVDGESTGTSSALYRPPDLAGICPLWRSSCWVFWAAVLGSAGLTVTYSARNGGSVLGNVWCVGEGAGLPFTCAGFTRGGGMNEGKESTLGDVLGRGDLEKMKAGEHGCGVLGEKELKESLFWKPWKKVGLLLVGVKMDSVTLR